MKRTTVTLFCLAAAVVASAFADDMADFKAWMKTTGGTVGNVLGLLSSSVTGLSVTTNRTGAWFGLFDYKTLAPAEQDGAAPSWLTHSTRLGPFKRPRNAMVALEREVTLLKNRHQKNILFGDQLWAEA